MRVSPCPVEESLIAQRDERQGRIRCSLCLWRSFHLLEMSQRIEGKRGLRPRRGGLGAEWGGGNPAHSRYTAGGRRCYRSRGGNVRREGGPSQNVVRPYPFPEKGPPLGHRKRRGVLPRKASHYSAAVYTALPH
ncbi:hypothetical protein SKAU_G00070800 [Synaphobranchus kaupii]|uniref:Uncharacterized protein n=1 Tax=Synaphobranchus kaupii TaxID=118154 RepID=A0A9Q1JBP6_SYNKA|nr:hypothetical protein SKAU_G00070800 [Synaphobranchus kaupii]